MKLKPFREAPDKKLGLQNDRFGRDFFFMQPKNNFMVMGGEIARLGRVVWGKEKGLIDLWKATKFKAGYLVLS